MEEIWWLTHGLTGYIDLSKRRVSPEDVVKCEERYNKSKAVHSIMRHVAEATQTPLETLYQQIAWPLDRKFGHSHDAFKLAITYVIWQGHYLKDVSDIIPTATPMSGTMSSSPPHP
jgi:translation initiation factor 2 alpha subunit (eIF-2alpha)